MWNALSRGPSAGTVLGVIALIVALSGTAIGQVGGGKGASEAGKSGGSTAKAIEALHRQLKGVKKKIKPASLGKRMPQTIANMPPAGYATLMAKFPDPKTGSEDFRRDMQSFLTKAMDNVREPLIDSVHLAVGAVTAPKISSGAVTAGAMANKSVLAAAVADHAITADAIASDAVGARQIAPDSINTGKIVPNAITSALIAPLSINTGKIANNAISTSQIAPNSITNGLMANHSISTSQIVPNTITGSLIANGAVSTNQIAANSITSGLVASNAITAAKIVNDAITAQKLADNAVTAETVDVPSAEVSHNSPQAIGTPITHSSGTIVAFNTERHDGDGMHSTTTNNGRITVSAGGVYDISARVVWEPDADGFRQLMLAKNGTIVEHTVVDPAKDKDGNPAPTPQTFNTSIKLNAGDFVELRGWQFSAPCTGAPPPCLTSMLDIQSDPKFSVTWDAQG